MNPTFDHGLDIAHVERALELLTDDGQIVAIMSAGTEFRNTRQAKRFRERMGNLNARWIDLPAGTFESVGTSVNTVVMIAHADGTKSWRW